MPRTLPTGLFPGIATRSRGYMVHIGSKALCLVKTPFQRVAPAECNNVNCLSLGALSNHRRSTGMLLILGLFERDDIFGRHRFGRALFFNRAFVSLLTSPLRDIV